MKDLREKLIEEAAGHYLSEQDGLFPSLYEAYMKLVEKCEEGYGNSMADCFVNVWQPLEDQTVKEIADLIEGGADQLEVLIKNVNVAPAVITGIDWSELRKQKHSLLQAMIKLENRDAEDPLVGDLDGILHLIDNIQDYAVDVAKIVDSIHVYDFEAEEDREDS